MNRKKILGLFAAVLLYGASHAQIYKNAVGLRISGGSNLGGAGATYKHYLNEQAAIEAIFAFRDPVGVGAMYQLHKPWNVLDNLNWYYGGGAFVTFGKENVGAGGMGVIGVDYKFDNLPLNIALDWKPELAFAPKFSPNFNTFGLSIRYVFNKK